MGAAETTKTASLPDTKLLSCSPSATKLLFELGQAELVTVIAETLQECATSNDEAMDGRKQEVKDATRFHAKQPPPISLQAYLQRLLQLTPYPLDALLLAVVYIDRVTRLASPPITVAADATGSCCETRRFRPLFDTCRHFRLHDPTVAARRESVSCSIDAQSSIRASQQEDAPPPSLAERPPHTVCKPAATSPPSPPLTRYTAHRLMLASLVVAARYGSDYNITRVRAAKVAGLPMDELFHLELDFFALLSFSCRVRSSELEAVCAELWYRTDAGKRERAERSADAKPAVDASHDRGEPQRHESHDLVREEERSQVPVEFCFTPPARRMSGYAGKRLPGRFPLSLDGPSDVDGTPSATPPLSEGESDSSYFSSSSVSSILADEGRECGDADLKEIAPSASRTVTPTLSSQLSVL